MSIADTLQPVLERKFPAALVAAFLLQSAGAIYWAGSASNRIAVLEQTQQRNQTTIDRVAVMQEQITEMKQQLTRIEAKLDRNSPAAPAP
jgi:hypothetical protein